ncbi:MAG: transcription elongation factor GreB [Proteobacteria bacterium]|nr:transcription elongation factor GreB [Pseudomonadota bacterium]
MRPMTQKGYRVITDEIDRLWSEERPMVVREVSAAAELGDRSENAAYIYGKKRLRNIDSRLRYLKKKIADVRAIDVADIVPVGIIKFGAIVVAEKEDGEVKTWRLVDKEESEPKLGRISLQSPVGKALQGKEKGDVIVIKVPGGDVEYEILEVRYGAGDP